jgi:hypothetical protein
MALSNTYGVRSCRNSQHWVSRKEQHIHETFESDILLRRCWSWWLITPMWHAILSSVFFFLGRGGGGGGSLATSEKAREGANVKNGPNSPHYEEQKSKVTIFREELPTRRIP